MKAFEETYEARVDRLLNITHEPINMPRKLHIGEQVFYAEWKRLMTRSLDVFDDSVIFLEHILHHLSLTVNQRHATVCASFIKWLGTNCGRSFLHDANRFSKSDFFTSKEKAFLACWALENHRHRSFNRGGRVTEHLLRNYENGFSNEFPEPSADDYEVIDHLVYWLGSNDGIEFVSECVKKIDDINSIESTIERMNRETTARGEIRWETLVCRHKK
jgi:hypothetical protein